MPYCFDIIDLNTDLGNNKFTDSNFRLHTNHKKIGLLGAIVGISQALNIISYEVSS